MGYSAVYRNQDVQALDLHVLPAVKLPKVPGLDGQSFTFHVDENLLGRALWQRVVEQLPPKAGARVVLLKGAEKLCMKKTLKEHCEFEEWTKAEKTEECFKTLSPLVVDRNLTWGWGK